MGVGLLTNREVLQRTGITPRLLAYYRERGLIDAPLARSVSYRQGSITYYPESVVADIQFIQSARHQGRSINWIRQQLAQRRERTKTLSLEEIRAINPEALRVIFWVMDSLRFSFPGKEIVGSRFSFPQETSLRMVELEYIERPQAETNIPGGNK